MRDSSAGPTDFTRLRRHAGHSPGPKLDDVIDPADTRAPHHPQAVFCGRLVTLGQGGGSGFSLSR
jgi:hypothetical protein